MKEQQKQIVQNYVDSYNTFDIAGMTRDLDKNIVFENISNGNLDLKTLGLNEFKEQAEIAKQYFKERKMTIESWNFSEENVEIAIDYKAVLATDLPTGQKKGDTLQLKGKSEFLINNGKIQKITDKS